MIRVNLLPPERRRPEKTPLPRFMLVLVAAALTTGVIVALAFIFLNIYDVGNEIDDIEKNKAGLASQVAEHDKLDKIVGAVDQKETAIKDLTKRNVMWSDVLDYLWTILDAEKSLYIMDFRTLDENQARGFLRGPGGRPLPRDQAPGFGLQLEVRIFGLDTTRMTALRAALANHKELQKVLPLMNPKPTIVYNETGTDGPQMEFTLVLLGKPGSPRP